MGDPRRLKPKYSGPRHPWQSARIEEEKKLKSEFGLKNKEEIWKASSKLKGFANQAKKLTAEGGKQAGESAASAALRLDRAAKGHESPLWHVRRQHAPSGPDPL